MSTQEDLARRRAEEWVASLRNTGEYDEGVIAEELRRRHFEAYSGAGTEEPIVLVAKGPSDVVATVRRGIGEAIEQPADSPEVSAKYDELEPWACIWDYYVQAYYEVAYMVLPEAERTHPFFRDMPSLLPAFGAGLGFVVNLGGLLVGVPLPAYRIDDRQRLHCPDGPALRWADGEQTWWWHDLSVPREWIMSPEALDVAKVFRETQGQEHRRALCEIVGWSRVVDELGARVIQRDDWGALYEGDDLGDDHGRKPRWVRVKCPSTGREYTIRCHPESRTARDALARAIGLEEAEYRFSVES